MGMEKHQQQKSDDLVGRIEQLRQVDILPSLNEGDSYGATR
jgi:hypothetical protein